MSIPEEELRRRLAAQQAAQRGPLPAGVVREGNRYTQVARSSPYRDLSQLYPGAGALRGTPGAVGPQRGGATQGQQGPGALSSLIDRQGLAQVPAPQQQEAPGLLSSVGKTALGAVALPFGTLADRGQAALLRSLGLNPDTAVGGPTEYGDAAARFLQEGLGGVRQQLAEATGALPLESAQAATPARQALATTRRPASPAAGPRGAQPSTAALPHQGRDAYTPSPGQQALARTVFARTLLDGGIQRGQQGQALTYYTPQGNVAFSGQQPTGPNGRPLQPQGLAAYQRRGVEGGRALGGPGGTLSVVGGRTPEEQALIDERVAGINRATESIRGLRQADRNARYRSDLQRGVGQFARTSPSQRAQLLAQLDQGAGAGQLAQAQTQQALATTAGQQLQNQQQQRLAQLGEQLQQTTDPQQQQALVSTILAMQGKAPEQNQFQLARLQTGSDEFGAPIYEQIPFNPQTGEFVYPQGRGASGQPPGAKAASEADAHAQAQQALARGASKEAINQRLQQMGYAPIA